jgi:hypothetical protein
MTAFFFRKWGYCMRGLGVESIVPLLNTFRIFPYYFNKVVGLSFSLPLPPNPGT